MGKLFDRALSTYSHADIDRRLLDLKSPAGSLIPGGTETVLMVEDDPAILKFGVTVLEQLGYNLLAADSPEKALVLAQSGGQAIDPLLSIRELTEKVREALS